MYVSSGPLTSATLTTVTSSGTGATTATTTKGEISCTTGSQATVPIPFPVSAITGSTSPTKNFVKSAENFVKSTASTSSRPPPPHKLNRSYTTIDRDKINKISGGGSSFNRKQFQLPEVTNTNTNSSQPGSPKILSLIRVSLKYVHLFFKTQY